MNNESGSKPEGCPSFGPAGAWMGFAPYFNMEDLEKMGKQSAEMLHTQLQFAHHLAQNWENIKKDIWKSTSGEGNSQGTGATTSNTTTNDDNGNTFTTTTTTTTTDDNGNSSTTTTTDKGKNSLLNER